MSGLGTDAFSLRVQPLPQSVVAADTAKGKVPRSDVLISFIAGIVTGLSIALFVALHSGDK